MISGAVFRRGTCGNMGGHRRIPEHKADGFAGRTSRGLAPGNRCWKMIFFRFLFEKWHLFRCEVFSFQVEFFSCVILSIHYISLLYWFEVLHRSSNP